MSYESDRIHDRFFPLSRPKADPETCRCCGKVALYRVEERGFCRDHYRAACVAEALRIGQLEAKADAKIAHHGQPHYSRDVSRTRREQERRRA